MNLEFIVLNEVRLNHPLPNQPGGFQLPHKPSKKEIEKFKLKIKQLEIMVDGSKHTGEANNVEALYIDNFITNSIVNLG